jgi:hypothetical protein
MKGKNVIEQDSTIVLCKGENKTYVELEKAPKLRVTPRSCPYKCYKYQRKFACEGVLIHGQRSTREKAYRVQDLGIQEAHSRFLQAGWSPHILEDLTKYTG